MRVKPAILVTASLTCLTLSANAQNLPNGAAKDVVQSACSACHQLNVVTNAGHTPDEWTRIVGDMMMKGAAVSAAEAPALTQYLASNFPPRARPQGAVVTGSAQASFREWQIPSRPFPHDPYAAADGSLWYTGMGGNVLGRLDPASGEVKKVSVPTQGALPYGMVVSSKGVPYFAEFGSNKLASIDPKTMRITEFTLPNRNAQPRRITITSDDVLWYGDYGRGYLGSYDPKTGKTREWKSPGGADSEPYGITALNDVIWYSESGVSPNTLVRFDPKTEKFQTWKIPSGGGVVRNMMPTPDGKLVLAESGENKIALVEVR